MPIDREKIQQSAQKYVDRKKYDRAIAEYQRIIQEDPTDARTLLKIGDLQARLQAYPDAIATYDRVGQYYAAQGFALKAIAVYKQIRELIRKHAPELADRYGHILPKLAEIYAQLGLTSDALSAYDEVATRLQRLGRDREAIDVFRKMVDLDATNALPHLRLAEACCRQQNLDEAISSFWTAAELLLGVERYDDALKVIERILHFRQEPRFARTAAELYLKRGHREDGLQALAKLQLCFQADPRNLDTLGLLAQAFTMIGQDAKAIEVHKEMARIARDQDKHELFEQLLAHLRQVAPNDEQVRALLSLKPRAPSGQPGSESVRLDEEEVEFVSEPPSEAPFELRRSAEHQAARPLESVAPESLSDDLLEPADDEEASLRPLHVSRAEPSSPELLVDEDTIADELVDAEAFDAHAHAQKAIVDVESFRKLRLYPKAIEALSIALEIDPESLELRQKLREILYESGDYEGSISEALTVASIHIERGAPQLAEPVLYEVLELDPEQPDALAMLEQLAPGAGYSDPPRLQPVDEDDEDLTAEEPLPAYDLHGRGGTFALPNRAQHQPSSALGTIDDPFGSGGDSLSDAPLPSFPLAEEDDDLMAGLHTSPQLELRHGRAPRAAPLPSFSDVGDDLGFDDELPPTQAESALPVSAGPQLEDAIDEADFFTARGLYEDARAILQDQLARMPGHAVLVERLREIEHALLKSAASQTIERTSLPGLEQPKLEEDRAFDIAASLDALDQLEQPVPAKTAAKRGGFASMQQEVDVEQVFAKFKEGVRAQVSENDASTRYDLGVAYKEMGLLPDAITEFEIAARDPSRECNCYAMVGMIELERGDLDAAAEAYIRALNAAHKTVEQEMALYYDLGNVYELKKRPQDALYYFQKIARRDPGYRDIKDRISALQPKAISVPPARAVNDDDEFDRVFNELFDQK